MKKALTILTIAASAAIFAACGGGDGGGSAADIQIVAPTVVETGANLQLPLTTEPTTFRIWSAAYGGIVDAGLNTMGESPWFQELNRRTGVTMEFIHPPTGQAQENLNLLIASGDFHDAVQIMGTDGGSMIPGGMAAGINDGFILDATDWVYNFAPYYWQVLNANDNRRRAAFTDDGRLPGFWQVNIFQPPWFGLATRGDWIDDLGIGMPTTFDDWHNALSLYRDEMGATAPMLLPNTGFYLFHTFSGAFDVAQGWFQVDGNIRFGPLEPGFRDYVQMMSEWFAEGLIDPDFTGRAFFFGPQDLTTTGQTGLWPDMFVMLPVNNAISPTEGYRSVAVPPPLRYPGQQIHLGQRNPEVEWITLMTSANQNPELFTRWVNYLFSPEGSRFANFGEEGVHWEYDSNGDPRFTPFMYDNDDWTLHNVQRRYVLPIGNPFYYDWRRENTPGLDPDAYAAPTTWATNMTYNWIMPPITLTADEGAENARIMNDVNTHRDEMVARFITGAEPMANWDNFIQTLHNMGIERAMEIQQAALDRFYAR